MYIIYCTAYTGYWNLLDTIEISGLDTLAVLYFCDFDKGTAMSTHH